MNRLISYRNIFFLTLAALAFAPVRCRLLSEPDLPPNAPQTEVAETTPKPKNIKDLLEKFKTNTSVLVCDDIFPTESAYKCPSSNGPSTFTRRLDLNNFYVPVESKNNPLKGGFAWIDRIPEPELVQRKVQGYALQKSLNLERVRKILEIWPLEGALVLVTAEDIFCWTLGVMKLIQPKNKKEIPPRTAFREIFEALKAIHEQGIVAIDYRILRSSDPTDKIRLKIGRMGCAVKVDEEIGKCSFDPLTTDPIALAGDPTVKADPAMDFYALGILLFAGGSFQKEIDTILYDFNMRQELAPLVEPIKKSGKFMFEKGLRMDLVLLTAVLLQQDRAARSNTHVISQIISSIDDEDPKFIEESFEYDWTTDPLKAPALKTLAQRVRVTAGVAFEKAGSKKSIHIDLSDWRLWAIIVGIVIVLITIAIIFKNQNRGGARPRPDAPMHPEQTLDAPTVMPEGGPQTDVPKV